VGRGILACGAAGRKSSGRLGYEPPAHRLALRPSERFPLPGQGRDRSSGSGPLVHEVRVVFTREGCGYACGFTGSFSRPLERQRAAEACGGWRGSPERLLSFGPGVRGFDSALHGSPLLPLNTSPRSGRAATRQQTNRPRCSDACGSSRAGKGIRSIDIPEDKSPLRPNSRRARPSDDRPGARAPARPLDASRGAAVISRIEGLR